MTELNREQIEAAHYAVERLARLATKPGIVPLNEGIVEDYQEMILKALPPRPRPTMADVVWNDEEHFLAEAKIKNGPLVAMIGEVRDQWIICIPIETDPSLLCKRTEFEGYLTPTGKRYTLTEVQE
ncbi:hypothetical protein HMPREF2978_00620 [Corynebacterium sp. HMSC074C01]|uniref:hypothetical protein n=1 Tax=unclassified Corynebacterium TaxID=2624378 RepID=UPI0008A233EA|nr:MULTISPECIES: hypothetical protein [unclassified Corynebacterium]OFP63518.1 hypothetical protein HMPREF2978_00620 [Corynebacterium sp. HMSC074C01]OHO60916.1 hypothetical protein HMPREF2743_04895 [Corynebacterium sp. HMSC036D02]